MIKTKTSLNYRALASMLLLLSGSGLPLTGIMNHAYQFDKLSMARHAWMSAHNILASIFVVSACWHVALNSKTIISYIRGLGNAAKSSRKEFLWAASLVLGLTAIVVGHVFHVGQR